LDGGEMKINHLNQSKKAVTFLILLLLISISIFDINALADDPLSNTVSVVAESETISSETFTINITCNPSEGVKSFEMDLSFDPSIFTVSDVSEGDFFSGYTTFFNDGSIDNTIGTISDVYGLIVGAGTVDSSGVLISLSCTVVSEGSCAVEISSVGLTDESAYLTVSTVNDTVTIDQSGPVVNSESIVHSDPLDTDPDYGWVYISCEATDAQGIDEVIVSVICPNASVIERSCSQGSGNTYYWNSSSGGSMFTNAGNYSITITVTDSTGNDNTSSTLYLDLPENWDMNIDGICDLLDFVAVSNHYSETNAQSGWIREDVDNNGEIAVLDLVMLSNDYESTW
jgi:hypothetical protein